MSFSQEQKDRLRQYLKDLRLSTILERFESVAKLASEESFGPERYLFELVEQEAESRGNRKIASLLKQSKLPMEKSLKAFDQKRLPQKVRHQLQMLLKGDFIKNKENVLAFGNPGAGKSHLLSAIAQELIRQRQIKVYFSTCNILIQNLLIAKRNLEIPKLLKKLSNYDLLYIDDIGYVQQSREEMEVLFTLLAACYEQTSVMITSNLAFSNWEQIFKDPMTTAAVIDRLVHHSVILELNLSSYRLQAAKESKSTNETIENMSHA